jgi:hypothetical protein
MKTRRSARITQKTSFQSNDQSSSSIFSDSSSLSDILYASSIYTRSSSSSTSITGLEPLVVDLEKEKTTPIKSKTSFKLKEAQIRLPRIDQSMLESAKSPLASSTSKKLDKVIRVNYFID